MEISNFMPIRFIVLFLNTYQKHKAFRMKIIKFHRKSNSREDFFGISDTEQVIILFFLHTHYYQLVICPRSELI